MFSSFKDFGNYGVLEMDVRDELFIKNKTFPYIFFF